MRVLVVNGPNLNLLGTRRPDVYGQTTLGDLEELCRQWGAELGCTVTVFQSNHEGAIIDRLHEAIGRFDGIIINPGALTHYSYAIHDAIEAVAIDTVEVHISDISAREEWRAKSVVAPACRATISGEGVAGYRRAIEVLVSGGAG
ncbi:MAG TPA: type II 3-dehydroquinate dehydratase [Acidimicrobiia bacterium]|nr:type II 3-dehydroquinate dehydratase [Acidimicrobiia bacterium]